jgi:D-glycero-alpha-D-manno-heptose-7-phosphate kinase
MIISRAPLRISFFGGGTDYPDYFREDPGAVLATAIDKFSYVTASPFPSQLFDYSLRVAYRKVESVGGVSDIEHHVFRECLKLCALERDIELHNIADLPAFSGLGSSSTFTVALLHALHSFKGEFVQPLELAYEAIHVERHCLNENVGCQDQTLAAMGGFNLVEFRSEDHILCHRLPLSPPRLSELERHLLLVFTRITRRASDIVSHQLRRVEQNRPTLQRMRGMVDEGWNILCGNRSLVEFGQLLHQAWLAKHSLDENVSNSEIDTMYRRGLEAGAIGGKLLGAGGGGFLLFFAPPEVHPALEAAFASHQIVKVKLAAPGSQIIFS